MNESRRVAWGVIEEILGKKFTTTGGSPSATTFLRGDGMWATPASGTTDYNALTNKPTLGTAAAQNTGALEAAGTAAAAVVTHAGLADPHPLYALESALGTLATQNGSFSGTSSGTNTGDQSLAGLVPTSRTVAGKALTADVALVKGDVGLGNVDNTSDANKIVSTATQTALNGKQASGSYATASHTHIIGDVTGLQAALDGKQASGAYALAAALPNASYRTILDSSGSHIAARVAGTYGLSQGQPAAITAVGTLYPLNTIYIDSADFPTLNGVAPKLRVRAQLYVNDVAPTGNYTFGLHPITRPATSGGAGLAIYTIGAAVSGSPIAINAPAVDTMNNAAGADFALPANGHYVLGFVSNATVAANSHLHISASLQMRNV